MGCRADLLKIYHLLDGYFGALHWWPAKEPFEVVVGAILTQNTAWTNVEKAIGALRQAGLLSCAALSRVDEQTLAAAIRPSGYYRVKAGRLKNLVHFLEREYAGSCKRMAAEETHTLRQKLLRIGGVGPETADSILLYACDKPVFVSDAYTRRILERHGLIREGTSHDEIRSLFMTHLPKEADLFNQYHALLVHTGKSFCRKKPLCLSCPLRAFRPQGSHP